MIRLERGGLGDLGFEVVERIDADQKTMKYAIVEFGERLEAAGEDAVGLFFYAGHGLQVNGENYLVRMDAPRGSLVAYSTAPGQVARDGADGASVH